MPAADSAIRTDVFTIFVKGQFPAPERLPIVFVAGNAARAASLCKNLEVIFPGQSFSLESWSEGGWKTAPALLVLCSDAGHGVYGGEAADLVRTAHDIYEVMGGHPTVEDAGAADMSQANWRVIRSDLEKLRTNGEKWTSCERMAAKLHCSASTIHKAIKNGSVELEEWASKQQGASRLNATPDVSEIAFEQASVLDPKNILEDADIDLTLEYLMNQAEPREVERIKSMPPAEQRLLVETLFCDPDLEEQVERYRIARRARG